LDIYTRPEELAVAGVQPLTVSERRATLAE